MEREYCPYCMNPVTPGEACPNCGLTAGAYTPSPHHLPPGTVLQDRYLVGRVLGEGGFGITYIGCDLRLELKIAIKEYFPTDRSNRIATASLNVTSYTSTAGSQFDSGKAKFLREAQTMARLDRQPNIVSVKDYFEANNTAYIVMEYIDGTTFKELVAQRGGRLPSWELLHLIEPLFSSLTAMHELGLIHRDISPENLMLENGMVRLLDFGCAREAANGDATMTIMLRHGFAPLEQYQSASGGQGPWTDVYALSATIYYCITGKKPMQAMDRLLEDTLTPPRKLGADLTAAQERALMHGLNIHPRKRFQTAQEMHTALYEGTFGEPGTYDKQPDAYDRQEETLRQGIQEEPHKSEEQEISKKPEEQKESKKSKEPGEIQSINAKDSGKKPESGFSLPAWIINHKVPVISGAAILLICIIIFAAGSIGKTTGEGQEVDNGDVQTSGSVGDGGTMPGGSGSPEGGASANGEQTALFENATRLQDPSFSQSMFIKMLQNDRVSAIIVPKGTNMDITEPLEITKPVLLENGACMNFYAAVTISSTVQIEEGAEIQNQNVTTVAGDGQLIVDGSVTANGVLKAMDGGSIRLSANGYLWSPVLWLEQETDLIGNTDQTDMEDIRRLVVDEDSLFRDATHVSDFQAFREAAEDPHIDAIVVDGGFALEDYIDCEKSLMISEGSTLTSSSTECELKVRDLVINRGSLRLNSYLNIEEKSRFINYGVADSLIYCEPGERKLIVNAGSMNMQYGQCINAIIVNAGSMCHEGPATGSDDNFADIVYGEFYNYGDFAVAADNIMWMGLDGQFYNTGEFQIENNARFEHHGNMENSPIARIIVDGELDNSGGCIYMTMPGNLIIGDDGEVYNGLIGVASDENIESLTDNRQLHSVVFVERWSDLGDVVSVSTTEELLAEAKAADHRKPILVTENMRVSELELHGRDLIVGNGVTLSGQTFRITNGVLRIRSDGVLETGRLLLEDNAFFLNEYRGVVDINLGYNGPGMISLDNSNGVLGGEVNLNGGSLKLNQAVLYSTNNIGHAMNITLDNNSHFYHPWELIMDEGFSINIASGSFVTGSFEIKGNIDIGKNGRMDLIGYVTLYDGCSIVNNGALIFENKEHWFHEGSSVINNGDGFMDIEGWEWQSNEFNGEIINRGQFDLGVHATINGKLRNEGEMELFDCLLKINGTVENNGKAYTFYDTTDYIGKNGWSGNPLQYRSQSE